MNSTVGPSFKAKFTFFLTSGSREQRTGPKEKTPNTNMGCFQCNPNSAIVTTNMHVRLLVWSYALFIFCAFINKLSLFSSKISLLFFSHSHSSKYIYIYIFFSFFHNWHLLQYSSIYGFVWSYALFIFCAFINKLFLFSFCFLVCYPCAC